MTENETFMLRFHAERPGVTSAAWARAGTYAWLADHAAAGERVLDIGCGDGYLLALLASRGARPVGLDLSAHELVAARGRGDRDRVERAHAAPPDPNPAARDLIDQRSRALEPSDRAEP